MTAPEAPAARAAAPSVLLRLLGPVRLEVDGVDRTPLGPLLRGLLAALGCARGGTVPAETLAVPRSGGALTLPALTLTLRNRSPAVRSKGPRLVAHRTRTRTGCMRQVGGPTGTSAVRRQRGPRET